MGDNERNPCGLIKKSKNLGQEFQQISGGLLLLIGVGGKRWTPQYFVRREAWHALDHTWEIEDRLK